MMKRITRGKGGKEREREREREEEEVEEDGVKDVQIEICNRESPETDVGGQT